MINAIKFAIEEIEASDQYLDHTGSKPQAGHTLRLSGSIRNLMNAAAGPGAKLAAVTPAPYALLELQAEPVEHRLGRAAGYGCDGGHRLAP